VTTFNAIIPPTAPGFGIAFGPPGIADPLKPMLALASVEALPANLLVLPAGVTPAGEPVILIVTFAGTEVSTPITAEFIQST
jgi:hypothetical protein